jgi:hypothetical protein
MLEIMHGILCIIIHAYFLAISSGTKRYDSVIIDCITALEERKYPYPVSGQPIQIYTTLYSNDIGDDDYVSATDPRLEFPRSSSHRLRG